MKVIFSENIGKIAKKIKQYDIEEKIDHEISRIENALNITELLKIGKLHKMPGFDEKIYLYRIDMRYRFIATVIDENFLILDVVKHE